MGKQKKERNKKKIQNEREGEKATWKTALKIGLSRKTKGCQTAQKFVAKDESQKTRYVRQRERDRASRDKAQKKGFSLLAKSMWQNL